MTGIGLLEGAGGFNWMLLAKFFAGWVATLVVAGLTAAFFTAQAIYAPCKNASEERWDAGLYLNGTSNSVAALLQATGAATGNATLVQQAQQVLAAAGLIQMPILSLMGAGGPVDVQAQALGFAGNASVWQTAA